MPAKVGNFILSRSLSCIFYDMVAQHSLKSSQANNPFTLFPAFVLILSPFCTKHFRKEMEKLLYILQLMCMGKRVADLFFCSSDIDPPGFFLSA